MIIHWIDKEHIGTVADLQNALENCPNGIIGISPVEIRNELLDTDIENWLKDSDIIHSGLSFGAGNAFHSVQLCTFNWHFLNPLVDRPTVSWKATTDFFLFDYSTFERIGNLDVRYSSPDAALMDWTYRALVAGAKTINRPIPLSEMANKIVVKVTLQDEMLFVSKHFNKRAQAFFRFSHFIMNGILLKKRKVTSTESVIGTENKFKLTITDKPIEIDSYAALIPTISRYDFVSKSIESLLSLKFPPKEIVVVDQTPEIDRRLDVYEPYLEKGILKLIWLDKAGQSTARNEGLKQISCPWVLLFEDDAEAWPGMVDEHISLIKKSNCDVSTGVIVPPGANSDFIPELNRKYFLADILTTGNAFMRTETALSAGGFDPAFDRGPGADDDFGKRLYLSGKTIVYNYKSIETHYKAPQGGMRVHGVWWRNKSTLLGAYPPITQSFVIMKYYPKKYHLFLFLNMVLKARKKYSLRGYLLFILLLPYKIFISIRQAKKLDMSL